MFLKNTFIALSFCLLGSSALAQQTTCYRLGYQTVCNTTPDYLKDIPSDEELRERQQRQQAAEALEKAQIAQRNRIWVRQRVGELVSSGQCDYAKSLAVHWGEFELAEQAMKFCTPK